MLHGNKLGLTGKPAASSHQQLAWVKMGGPKGTAQPQVLFIAKYLQYFVVNLSRLSRFERTKIKAVHSWQRRSVRSERSEGPYFTCHHSPCTWTHWAATSLNNLYNYTRHNPRTSKQDHSVHFSKTQVRLTPPLPHLNVATKFVSTHSTIKLMN